MTPPPNLVEYRHGGHERRNPRLEFPAPGYTERNAMETLPPPIPEEVLAERRSKENRIRVMPCEVYSRQQIVGYYRPVRGWNEGKQEEFRERAYVEIPEMEE